MKRNKEIIPQSGNPFSECKLDRKKYADVLTSIISTSSEGFVLAINNKWGTGKTTFIKMWEQDLKDNYFQTIFFNAWENDFENNALTALLGELKTISKVDRDTNLTAAIKKAALFSKNLAPVVVKALVKKHIGEDIADISEGLTKGVADIFENDVNEYAEKKKNIIDFKENLKNYIANNSNGKTVVFIVDELDRCRPDYAVSILEQIKHFFSIPNIVFVLSIDKQQLECAVKGVYGSENIDANEYLRRFIDIEYSIPEPNIENYVMFLYDYYSFDDFFRSNGRSNYRTFDSDVNEFKEVVVFLFKNKKFTLRQQDKIFSHTRLSLRCFQENSYVFPYLYVFLITLKLSDSDFYIKLKNKEIEVSELQNYFYEIIKKDIDDNNKNFLIWLESFYVFFYNRYKFSFSSNNSLYKYISGNDYELLHFSLIDKSENNQIFLNYLLSIDRDRDYSRFDISFIFNKIDLLESLHS